ncbi:MAG TPA: hypothetical protein VK141_05345 [Nitrosomonas sp.]|nr:hypothetical protein [Nitrosomonas sp.]
MKNILFAIGIELIFSGCRVPYCNQYERDISFAFFLEDSWEWNRIDSFNGEVTVDYSTNDERKVKLCFSQEEMDSIRTEMRRIDIMSYPTIYHPLPEDTTSFGWNVRVDPHPVYRLKIILSGKTKEIYWNDDNFSQIKGAQRLRRLMAMIQRITKQKSVYQQIPRKLRMIL